MKKYIDRDMLADYSYRRYGVTASEIMRFPTADVQPVKHGQWFGTVCSNCGSSDCNYFDHDYCPFCGSKQDL